MPTQEILRDEWKDFFQDFTRFHQGWIVAFDVFSYEMGAQRGTEGMPFEAIFVEEEKDGRESIELFFGERPEPHLTHTITAAKRVRFESEGESEVLQIEDEDDTTVLMSFRRSFLPAKVSYGALTEWQ